MDLLLALGLGVYLLASVWLLFYGLNAHLITLLYLCGRRRARESERDLLAAWGDRSDAELPVVTTQLPIYNEKNVVERLVNAVCAMDWPRDRHEIQVLDDSTDETRELTAELVARLRAAGHDIHHLHRRDRAGYKAGALAAGLEVARGEHVAIFDADFVPEPDFLRRTIPFLEADDRCAWVQTRWGHRNRDYSLLTYLQSVGIDGHFVVEQEARAAWGLFCNFNGTAGVWRKAAIEDAGGWQPDTLTEDLDLSYRAMLRGWRPRFLGSVVSPAEIPTDINALKSQQRRWAKGSIQTALKLLPRVLAHEGSGWFRKVQACLHLTHYLIHPLILVMTLLVLPLVQLMEARFTGTFTTPLVAVMLLALCGPSTLYVVSQAGAGASPWRAAWHMPAMICFGIGLAVNNSRAVFEGMLGRPSEFVRTPKLGARAERDRRRFVTTDAANGPGRVGAAVATDARQARQASWKLYRSPASRLVIGEIFMGVWAAISFLAYLGSIGTAAGAVLLLQATGFTLVGVISLNHSRSMAGAGR
jgi:cellulose synthase/poly-beta-1,6-N-acetylglucosamine synthase-like glycosyltransferase